MKFNYTQVEVYQILISKIILTSTRLGPLLIFGAFRVLGDGRRDRRGRGRQRVGVRDGLGAAGEE